MKFFIHILLAFVSLFSNFSHSALVGITDPNDYGDVEVSCPSNTPCQVGPQIIAILVARGSNGCSNTASVVLPYSGSVNYNFQRLGCDKAGYPAILTNTSNSAPDDNVLCPSPSYPVVFGISPRKVACFTDPPLPGSPGGPPNANGTCTSPLVKLGSVCVYAGNPTAANTALANAIASDPSIHDPVADAVAAANAGGDGYPPKPDGTCNPPLTILPSGVCGTPPPPEECLPPKSLQDGVCVEHTCPTGYYYHYGTLKCQAIDPCLDRKGQEPANGIPNRYGCIIKYVTANGQASCDSAASVSIVSPIYECEGWCVYKFVGPVTRYVYDDNVPLVPGVSRMEVYGKFVNSGYSCNAGNGTPEDEPAPEVLAATPPLTFTPSGPSGGVDLPPHCPDGYHNSNSASSECVVNSFSCPAGQHVVAIGTSGSGGVMEACVSDTSPTGSEGLPPSPSGYCVAPLVNVNGICSQPVPVDVSTGGLFVTPSCNLPNKLVDGVCTAPLACVLPNTLVNGVCTSPPGSSGQPPQSDGTCISPNTLVNGVCTSPPGSDGQPPQSDGTCISPNTLVNGVCSAPSGSGTTGTGSALASGQCGAPGLPICKTDIGDMLRSTTNLNEPATRSSSEILGLLNPGNYPLLNGIKTWQLPPHTSTCNLGSFKWENNYINKEISFKPVCDTFDTYKPQMSTAFLWLWTVLPFFIVIRS